MRRPMMLAVAAIVAVAALGACGGDDSARTPSGGNGRPETTVPVATAYVGLTKSAAIAKAKASDTPWRITREDDEQFMVTQDYDPTRLNFEIDDGKVTTATYG